MLFLDILDSAKSAHLQQYTSEWWRPENELQQRSIIDMARAEMMARILYGETIALSNNQATDSVAWMLNAPSFCGLDTPWEPVSVAFSGVQPASPADSIKEILVKYFTDHSFKLSSWIGLDDKQKEKVAKNLTKADMPNFQNMFVGVIDSMFDQQLADILNQQADGLQVFYEYLTNNRARQVSIAARDVGNQLWPRLLALKDDPRGIQASILDQMRIAATPEKVEFRSSLYGALAAVISDNDERNRVRTFIDRYYNEKMGLSVADGNGVFSTTNFDTETSLIEDSLIELTADKYNGEEGLLGKVVLEVSPDPLKNFIKWDDFVAVLKDQDFRKSALALRKKTMEYSNLKPGDPWYDRKYRLWYGQAYDALNAHHELLANTLGQGIVQKGSGIRMYFGPGLLTAASGILGSLVGGNSVEHIIYSFICGMVGYLSAEIMKDRIQPSIKTINTTGSLRTRLKDSVKLKDYRELQKK